MAITSKTHQTIAFPKPLIVELKKLAKQNGRSLSNYAQLALVAFIKSGADLNPIFECNTRVKGVK